MNDKPAFVTGFIARRAAFFYPAGEKSGLAEFEQRHHRQGRCLTFVEPQIATLQQLAILYAPENSNCDFVDPVDFDRLATALLITWELMEVESTPKTVDQVTAALAQAVLRNSFVWTPLLASRTHHAYRIGEPDASGAVGELRVLFEIATGVSCVKLPPRSPNLNAYAERLVRSIKSECLNRMIFFDGRHDGAENAGPVVSRKRVGGMLKYYHRAAA